MIFLIYIGRIYFILFIMFFINVNVLAMDNKPQTITTRPRENYEIIEAQMIVLKELSQINFLKNSSYNKELNVTLGIIKQHYHEHRVQRKAITENNEAS